jgi:hypothetical protein
MKGHMKDGKFHPHTEHKKGVSRKKRLDQSELSNADTGVKINKSMHNEGLRLKRTSSKDLEKMFEIKQASGSDERNERQFDRFTSSITDFGSGDIASAVDKADEVGISGSELADIVREFGDETGTPLNDIDVVAVLFDHILQNARNEIDSVLNFDVMNDGDFYVAGNFLATTYDYSTESQEKLTKLINEASKSDLKRLSENIFVRSFLNDVEVF